MYTKAPNQNVKWDPVARHTFYTKSAPINSTPYVGCYISEGEICDKSTNE